jgi:hypothetical protein
MIGAASPLVRGIYKKVTMSKPNLRGMADGLKGDQI